jgi:hypothetical protein
VTQATIDDRLLHDASANLEGANNIIKAIQATGGHRFYDELRAEHVIDDAELADYVQRAAATFRRISIEVSVACFMLKECSIHDRTFERFTELTHQVIAEMKARTEAGITGAP